MKSRNKNRNNFEKKNMILLALNYTMLCIFAISANVKMQVMNTLIDASDEIHERRVNPGSGVGKLLRQDLK